ncbi:hypothetical protein [Butyrivibrio sp. VCB2001]|uniref:hypothetical protein n=1 Tax=Butyrivibrio sp. VCB2001 TaxID=1280667 RepID=UPI0012DFDB49|nr:hypothetical protein [Butyrivibrio sp. VCB2001]
MNWLYGSDVLFDGIAVSTLYDNPKEINGITCNLFSSYPSDSTMIITLADKNEAKLIKNLLLRHGFEDIFFVDRNLEIFSSDEDC